MAFGRSPKGQQIRELMLKLITQHQLGEVKVGRGPATHQERELQEWLETI